MSSTQQTLTGEEATRVECEYELSCHNPAMYEVYVQGHWTGSYEETLACETCKGEHVEPEWKDREFRRLKPEERWSR